MLLLFAEGITFNFWSMNLYKSYTTFESCYSCIKASIQTVIDALNEINSRNEAISVATFGTKYSRVDQVKFLQDSL